MTRPHPTPTALLLDRFAWLPPDGWIDLATNAHVLVVEDHEPATSTCAWTRRCDRLGNLWHSHLAPLLDSADLGSRRVEVYACDPVGASPPPAPCRWVADAVDAFLEARGLAGGRGRPLRSVLLGNRERLVPDARLGLAAEDLEDCGAAARPDPGSRSTRDSRRTRSPERAIGLELVHRPALDAVQALLEENPTGPIPVSVHAAPGAGYRTFARAVARLARRRGLTPICGAALSRHAVRPLLDGRALLVFADADLARTLTIALRSARDVAIVIGRGLAVAADAHALELERPPIESLARGVTLFPPVAPDVTMALVRDGDGRPGGIVDAWLRDGWSRSRSFAWSARRTRPLARVAERRPASPWGEPRADEAPHALDIGWRLLARARLPDAQREFARVLESPTASGARLVDALWGMGACALEAARVDDSERWLRAAWCAVQETPAGDSRRRRGIRLALARCLSWQGRADEAAWLLDKLVPGGPAFATTTSALAVDALRLRARLATLRGQAHETLAILARASSAATTAAESAAVHGDCARVLGRLGDALAAAAHLREAVRALRRARLRTRALRLRVIALELRAVHPDPLSRSRRAAADLRLRRDARRLLAGDVPPLVRLRASLALEAHGWRRTQAVAAFIERWGERALQPVDPPAVPGEPVMVNDLQAVLEICHDADEPRQAIERVCHCVRERLRASSVAMHGAPADRGRLALSGSTRLATAPLALRLIDSGAVAAVAACDAGTEAGAPVTYGGRTIGAVVCRWALGPPVPAPAAEALIATAATAVAPHLQAILDRERLVPARDDDPLGLLGASPVVMALRERIRRVALAPFHVLIEGESGSGKEVVARALHAAGPRRRRRFCALNCAALTDDLIEAELFGHARGAFTGAVGERAGLFEEADGGSLFLDEVGELSVRAQAKLLRVIQEGEVRRVGENAPRRVDARLIAATNRSLRDEAAVGRFRADLLYRLDVVRIVVPPLRERPEDVVLLARAFWRDAAQRIGSRATLHPTAVAALARYHWPGNVRELQNVVMALAVNAPPRGAVGASRLPAAIAAQAQAQASAAQTLEAARRSFEERYVRSALARAANRPCVAARELGLTRQGLRKLLVRLRIELTPDTLAVDVLPMATPAVETAVEAVAGRR